MATNGRTVTVFGGTVKERDFMSIGLIGLLDDIAAIAKLAAASLDDVAAQASPSCSLQECCAASAQGTSDGRTEKLR
jgi:hypothetical protein